jgi:excinuclease ABC subunit C
VQGSIIQSYTTELQLHLDENKVDILQMAIIEIRDKLKSVSNEIIVPFNPELEMEGIKFVIPKRGDKRKLLELSEKNAKYYRLERLKMSEKANPALKTERLLAQMQKDLRLPKPPVHIECFDNSNLQGTNAVSACVVFKNAKPYKSEYRKFHVKTVEGIDDYTTMQEVITRRYKRLLDENKPLPDLIVIDGGKGQLNVAYEALKRLGIEEKVSLISIAERLEEIFIPHDSVPLYIDKNSSTLKVIQNIRNEAHRFGITFHRDVRSKNFVQSELDNIKGIGPATIRTLLSEYKSIDGIKKATHEQLAEKIGKSRADIIFAHIHKK